MSHKSNLFFAFALGAMAGAAVAKFLDSDEGEEVMNKAKDTFSSLTDELKEKFSHLENEFSEFMKGKPATGNEA